MEESWDEGDVGAVTRTILVFEVEKIFAEVQKSSWTLLLEPGFNDTISYECI